MTGDGMAVGLCDRRDDDVSDPKNLARSCRKVLAYTFVSTPLFFFFFLKKRRVCKESTTHSTKQAHNNEKADGRRDGQNFQKGTSSSAQVSARFPRWQGFDHSRLEDPARCQGLDVWEVFGQQMKQTQLPFRKHSRLAVHQ